MLNKKNHKDIAVFLILVLQLIFILQMIYIKNDIEIDISVLEEEFQNEKLILENLKENIIKYEIEKPTVSLNKVLTFLIWFFVSYFFYYLLTTI